MAHDLIRFVTYVMSHNAVGYEGFVNIYQPISTLFENEMLQKIWYLLGFNRSGI